MSRIAIPREYERFNRGVVVASTLLGVAGGVFPFGFGSIPGGLAGLFVGVLWVRIMMGRVDSPGKSILGPAIGWGGLMGLLAAAFLHGTVWTVLTAIGINDTGESTVVAIALMFGLPTGLVSGLLLGAVCGGLLQGKAKRSRLVGEAGSRSADGAGGA
jgi:hypothetical protein